MTAPNRSTQLGLDALWKTSRRPANVELIKRLVPIAQELAREARRRCMAAQDAEDGIIVADVRREAERRGIQLPKKPHFLGAVMRAAELMPTIDHRRSDIDQSHGNLQRVYIWPSERA